MGKKIEFEGVGFKSDDCNMSNIWQSINLEPSSCNVDIWTRLSQSQPSMVFPVEGKTDQNIKSGFGNRTHPIGGKVKHHDGIDIPAATGTNVLSATDGTVTFVGQRNGYGNTVEIEATMPDGNVIKTRYAHLDSFKSGLEAGQTVTMGYNIGGVGQTGGATGPHLHFETFVNGTLKNPVDTLNQYQPEFKLSSSVAQTPLTP
ncbi:MAG: M23 family metallopeptidase [Verrucomicrobiae bacterium]|nr:M23 family metallopeptidase [Verrucomicrobiae bacterium]